MHERQNSQDIAIIQNKTTHYIDFKRLNSELDPVGVLNVIDPTIKWKPNNGKEIRAFCPIHGSDKSYSLAISLDKKTFKCHSGECDTSGDLIALYAQSTGKTNQEAAQELISYFQLNNAPIDRPTNNKDLMIAKSIKTTQPIAEAIKQIWSESKENDSHPYLDYKTIKACPELRYGPDQQDNHSIVVPYFDIATEQLSAIQYVHQKLTPTDKGKYWLTGSQITKSIFPIGNLSTAETIYVAEGLSTIISIWMSQSENSNNAFVSCGGVNNMADKVKLLRSKYQTSKIIVCLDNDHTAQAIQNELSSTPMIQLCKPDFTDTKNTKGLEKVKDFNDLHQLAGLDIVKEQIDRQSLVSLKEPFTKIDNNNTLISNEEWIMLTHAAAEHDIKDYRQLIGNDGKVNYEKILALDQKKEQMEQSKNTLVEPAQQTTLESNEKHSTDKLLEKISLRMIEFSATGKIKLAGISSGFTGLDDITDGFQAGSLITIGARTGMGKTWFILNLIKNITIEQKKPVALFSLEMTEEEIIIRLCSLLSKIPIKLMKNGQLDDDQFVKIRDVLKKIKEAKLFIKDKSSLSNTSECCEEITKLHQVEHVEVIFIDHIGLMHDNGKKSENRTTEMGNITRKLKLLAKEISIPIICLAQLNRQADNNDRPRLSHLRESGAIEQDSDQIFFLHRNDYYSEDNSILDNIVELIVAKNRHGEQNKAISFKHDNWLLKEIASTNSSTQNLPSTPGIKSTTVITQAQALQNRKAKQTSITN